MPVNNPIRKRSAAKRLVKKWPLDPKKWTFKKQTQTVETQVDEKDLGLMPETPFWNENYDVYDCVSFEQYSDLRDHLVQTFNRKIHNGYHNREFTEDEVKNLRNIFLAFSRKWSKIFYTQQCNRGPSLE